jgi:hypothetical protein
VSEPADLGVLAASALLARRQLSSRELTEACLRRIAERDGTHSHDGDPASVNAWVRVYEEDALGAADRADERLAAGDAPALCGIPIGLKDLYAVAGKPLTASSSLLNEVPGRDCDVWARLAAEGMVLLGHLHTHEFAAGGTTDQVGNPVDLTRSAGGSSGGSAAALARDDARRNRNRHGGVASHPVGDVRHRDDQADARSRLDPRNRAARTDLRPRRPDDADACGVRAAVRRDGRARTSPRAKDAAAGRRLAAHR